MTVSDTFPCCFATCWISDFLIDLFLIGMISEVPLVYIVLASWHHAQAFELSAEVCVLPASVFPNIKGSVRSYTSGTKRIFGVESSVWSAAHAGTHALEHFSEL